MDIIPLIDAPIWIGTVAFSFKFCAIREVIIPLVKMVKADVKMRFVDCVFKLPDS